MTRRPSWRAAALAATVTVAACAAPGRTPVETTDQGGIQAERVVRGSTIGRAAAVAVATRPTPAPAVTAAPAPTVDPAATPTPAPTPLPSPPVALTPAHEAVRASLNTKLAGLARIGFLQTQANLISDNSAGVIANNSAGVISNNAGGIISDNGLGLISNNGGGIISDNGLGYRVAQAAEAITTGPLQGEELALGALFADDSRQLTYYVPATFTPDKPNMRLVSVNPAGHGVTQTQRKALAVYPPPYLPKQVEDTTIQADALGRFQCDLVAGMTFDAAGLVQTVDIAPDKMHWRDAASGVSIDVGGFAMSFADDKASYAYTFTTIGQVEKGDLTKLRRRADKNILLNLMHPEFMGDVTARIEKTDGTLLYGKTITYVDSAHSRFRYDLQDGLVLTFDRQDGNRLVGQLEINGRPEADAFLERRSGAHIFSITFPEEPSRPIVVGFGNFDAPDGPATNRTVWNVTTAAGSATVGRANGVGAAASFTALAGLARSSMTPNRLYACDQGAHMVRALDVDPATGAVTVSTVAGTGTAGAADGPGASASFNGPLGLAVGPDDTLYVADAGNHKIRAIAPDGTVSSFAGSGTQGVADGAAGSAAFVMPAGLALAGDGALWVADAGVSTIRKVSGGVVSTVAGTPTVTGKLDGTGTAARFNTPTAIAFNRDGNLLVADANNFALRQLTPAGVVTTLIYNADPNTYVIDGPADQTAINNFKAITIGPSGTPYLGGDNVRMLRPDGRVGTYVGAHATLYQDSDHIRAAFLAIQGLAFGPNNILYIADGTRLRKVTPKNAPTP